MEQNWDPGVKKFFVKILNSISLTICWMMAAVLAGIYYELGDANGKPVIYTIIFYVATLLTLLLLIRYLYKTWKSS